MKKLYFILQSVLPLILLGSIALPIHAAELVSIKDVTLIDTDLNDGDSFRVNAAGRELHLRLYYVDCLETTARGFLKNRILQQKNYFALKNISTALDFGKQAAEFTQRLLSKPFTIHTRYAKAPGSSTNRYYAFVETNNGDDLGHLLVAQGLARIYGVTHPAPDGIPSKMMLAKLGIWRDAAMLKRIGIWHATDPDILVKLRLEEVHSELIYHYDLNTATHEQLQRITGIGPAIAKRIIANRPYQSVQELRNVRGIGTKKLEVIAPYVTAGRQGKVLVDAFGEAQRVH